MQTDLKERVRPVRPAATRRAKNTARTSAFPLDFPDLLTHDAAARLLDWYDQEARVLPWRYRPGVKPNPYRVWLSEIMLQQTTVKAVIPYFGKFVRKWPSVRKLADAHLDDVLAAWAGLGYYSRARNLHRCAIAIRDQYHGKFPRDPALLAELPGVGPYTAAAIAAIAFDQKATVVDGNVERVIARYFAVGTPLPAAKPELRRLADTLTPDRRSGDFAQAMMDLGATVCTPRRPSCLMCPLTRTCTANRLGLADDLPRRVDRAERPLRQTAAFVALREDGHVLLRRRPPAGLLGGMMEVPSAPWDTTSPGTRSLATYAPISAKWLRIPGSVSHVFTHFRLEVAVYCAFVPEDAALNLWAEPERCRFVARRDLPSEALPSVMRKIIAHALARR